MCVTPAGGETEALWKAVQLVRCGDSGGQAVSALQNTAFLAWQPLPENPSILPREEVLSAQQTKTCSSVTMRWM